MSARASAPGVAPSKCGSPPAGNFLTFADFPKTLDFFDMGAPMYQRDRKRLEDRQMDTLVGISKGIIADGVVNQQEAEFLLNWLETSGDKLIENPLVDRLFDLLCDALDDGFLDSSEAAGVLTELKAFAGGVQTEGEDAKPLEAFDAPPPSVSFDGKQFLFTGDFVIGGPDRRENRKRCEADVESMGGVNAKSVTRKLDYLVVGTERASAWKHETYGGKIEKAVNAREKRGQPAIISEQHFVQALMDQSRPA